MTMSAQQTHDSYRADCLLIYRFVSVLLFFVLWHIQFIISTPSNIRGVCVRAMSWEIGNLKQNHVVLSFPVFLE